MVISGSLFFGRWLHECLNFYRLFFSPDDTSERRSSLLCWPHTLRETVHRICLVVLILIDHDMIILLPYYILSIILIEVRFTMNIIPNVNGTARGARNALQANPVLQNDQVVSYL